MNKGLLRLGRLMPRLGGESPPHGMWHPSLEWTWKWVLRLVLPIVTYMLGQVVYWLWFDNVQHHNPELTLAGSIMLAFVTAVVGLWALAAWLTLD